MKNSVGVIGAGSWGTTLSHILGENGHSTLIWAYEEEVCREINEGRCNRHYLPDLQLPPQVEATTDLQRICESCELILIAVPSHVFRGVVDQMGDFLAGDHRVVHCTKGIEQQTFKRMSEILREETCVRKLGVLSGPNLALEVAAGHPAGTTVSSKYEEVVRLAQHYLHNRVFRVYGGGDVIGAEVGGAFKNIVAIAAGIVDGLRLGENTKALLLTRGVTEMARYGAFLGAEAITFSGLVGIGDLMATCASANSRNRLVGERLARGETLEEIQQGMIMVAEGVRTARAVWDFGQLQGLDLPIVEAIYGILYRGLNVEVALGGLMSRKMKREFIDP